MANYDKWFPDLAASTRQEITKLYGGGEYTQSRLVRHTLHQYPSFERLFLARLGPSIRRQLELGELVEAGLVNVDADMATLGALAM